MTNSPEDDEDDNDAAAHAAKIFDAVDRKNSEPDIQLPPEVWSTLLQSKCTFPTDIFLGVMTNLVKNPNITSTHLFRADIFYDSGEYNDPSLGSGRAGVPNLKDHLKQEYQPRGALLPEWTLTRTIVRQLIPRNPQLDKPLVQTCHFFHRIEEDVEDVEDVEHTLVLYIPHIDDPSTMPFYHPAVAKIAFYHKWSSSSIDPVGQISISYAFFPATALTTKLARTALRLLQTVHKHGQGQLAGYQKRVHHDQIISQRRYQDTYTRLKSIYGRRLAESWVEVTDPGKHVFEDLGIAAFLIELWRDMYSVATSSHPNQDETPRESKQEPFPGFVDIGCGNGLLVYILLSEGYPGWGFDARRRKTWSIFPSDVQARLQQRLLVPKIYQDKYQSIMGNDVGATDGRTLWQNGVFASPVVEQTAANPADASRRLPRAKRGPFIISNHADELTLWTPLLAYLNSSSFIAIPCCSHNFAGARFRAPITIKRADATPSPSDDSRNASPHSHSTLNNSPAQDGKSSEIATPQPRQDSPPPPPPSTTTQTTKTPSLPNPDRISCHSTKKPATTNKPETGCLCCRRENKNSQSNDHIGSSSSSSSKPPSAYSSLCTYLSSLTVELSPPSARIYRQDGEGDDNNVNNNSDSHDSHEQHDDAGKDGKKRVRAAAEMETLRIPSTRNVAVIGRYQGGGTAVSGENADKGDEGDGDGDGDDEDEDNTKVEGCPRERRIVDIIQREMNSSIDCVAREWIERAAKLSRKPGSGH